MHENKNGSDINTLYYLCIYLIFIDIYLHVFDQHIWQTFIIHTADFTTPL